MAQCYSQGELSANVTNSLEQDNESRTCSFIKIYLAEDFGGSRHTQRSSSQSVKSSTLAAGYIDVLNLPAKVSALAVRKKAGRPWSRPRDALPIV